MAGPGTITLKLRFGDGVRNLLAEEREALRERLERLMVSHVPGQVIIISPLYDFLVFGPGSGRVTTSAETPRDRAVIAFGPEPNVARVPESHPLIEELLARHGECFVLEPPAKPLKVWACYVCSAEFPNKGLLAAHQGDHPTTKSLKPLTPEELEQATAE